MHVNNWAVVAVLSTVLVMGNGCANLLATTGTPGTWYGMSQEQALRAIEQRGYTVTHRDENTIVVDGVQEQLKQPAIKRFIFEQGRLIAVQETITSEKRVEQ